MTWLISLLVVSWATFALQSAPPASDATLVAEGLKLAAQLRLDVAADRPVFERIGYDRASALLSAALSHGQRAGATREDWAAMHRAAEGLIVLNEARGDLFRAAFFAGQQSLLYRNHEEDWEQALEPARRALAFKRAADPASQYIEQLALGEVLLALGRHAEAREAFRAGRDAEPDPLGTHAAYQWRSLVRTELASGSRADARREADAFLTLSASAPMPFRVHALVAAAEVDGADGKFDAALDRIRAARKLTQADPSAVALDIEISANLATLVLEAVRGMSYADAIRTAERIDAEFRGMVIEVTPFARAVTRARRRLSGDFASLIEAESAAVTAARATGTLGAQLEALRSLATTYASMNAFTSAEGLLAEAEALARGAFRAKAPPTNVVEARELYGLAIALADVRAELGWFSTSDTPKGRQSARELLDGAIADLRGYTDATLRRELGGALGAAILGRARVDALSGNVEGAIATLTAALRGEPREASFDGPDVLLRLARLERTTAPAAAVAHFEQGIAGLVTRRDRLSEISARLQLAEFLARSAASAPDRLDRARQQLAAVAREAQTLNYSEATWRVRFIEGLLADASGRAPEALAAYAAAIDRLDQIRAGLNRQEQRAAFVDNDIVQDVYRRIVLRYAEAGNRGKAWEYLERGKARAFLEMLQGRQLTADTTAVSGELRKVEQEIIDLRVALSPEMAGLQRGAGRVVTPDREKLRALEQRFAVIRQEAVVGASRATQPLALQPITLDEVSKALRPGTALIEYAFADGLLVAFVVTSAGAEHLVWPADIPRIRADVGKIREGFASAFAAVNTWELAQRLGEATLYKVVERLPAGIDHLVIVPTDVLSYLPFEALPAAPGTSLLIDRFSVSYLPSASTLQYLRGSQSAPAGSLFMGVLGNAKVEDWEPLPGTITETEAILQLFPAATRVMEGQFTRARAVEALRTFDRVHFATHGQVDPHAPIFSMLLMGTPSQGATRLSLYEIAGLQVKADMIVLSACETGLGRLQRGDEVTGLTRTFLQAGANSILSSLWQVSDDSTALLMAEFYRGLGEGLPPAKAHQRAVLATRKRFGHPFFWAPFILTGRE